MGKLTLILGGARSGKSTFAEKLAIQRAGRIVYIATAQALDEEMADRIAKHRRDRPAGWEVHEIPCSVGKALQAGPLQAETILLDCLTLLVSNLLMQIASPEGEVDETAAAALVTDEIDELLKAIQTAPGDWIIVSNEVGLGLVPPYPLGRVYRDQLGWANQQLAAHADLVIFMIAGIPMYLTPLKNST